MRSSLLAVLVGASVCPFVPAVRSASPAPSPAPGQSSLGQAIATVRERQAASRAASDAAGPKAQILEALFTKQLSVDFDATPARDAIDYLRTALGVHLIARYNDDPVGHGIDPKTPITLEMSDASAVEVLDLVLEQCSIVEQCTWQVRKSFLEVGTRDRLSVPAAQEVRIYPIDELLYEAPDFTNAPPSGFGYGYPGWVSFNGGTPDPHMFLDAYSFRYYGGYLGAGVGFGSGFGGGFSGSFGPGVSQGTVTTFGTDTNSDEQKSTRAEKIVDLVTSLIEPEAWDRNGGAWATIRYHDGALIVRAPDFIQRQLGGYPRLPEQDEAPAPAPTAAPGASGGTGAGASVPGGASAPSRGAAPAPRTAPGAKPATGNNPR